MMNMDDQNKTPNDGLEDEKAFADNLTPDEGSSGKPESVSEIKDDAPSSSQTKSRGRKPPWAGKIMGHFKLLRRIGEGSMGLVIQAEDTHLKRIVALKVLRKTLSTGEKGKYTIEQFLREARAAASIEHPNVVRVYEINEHAGWWYIAMEMVGGNSLREIVKAVGALSPAQACQIIADAAIGLQVVHEMGMIHRDIKPSNILVTRNGHGKISDFGLVRVDDPDNPVDILAHQSIGTPPYMAPEVIRHQTISSAVDIYSLGATLYYTLTGRPPFNAEKMEDIFKQHLHSEPPDIMQYFPDCSPNLAFLIQRMMAKEPAARPTAAEVAATLHAESISFPPNTPGTPDVGDSTVGADWQGLFQKTRTPLSETTVHTPAASTVKWLEFSTAKVRKLRWALSAIVIVLGLAGLAIWRYLPQKQPKQDRQAVSKLFPNAPESYGTRMTGIIPQPSVLLSAVPPFSWKGKVDVSGVHFIASQTGRYYYAIDDKRAALIRADQFVGYKTAEQATEDGKSPAP
jgi:serine/threonine protein kinase